MAELTSICKQCTKAFKPKAMPSAIKHHGRGKFCSKICYWLNKKGKPTGRANYVVWGADNPAWKGDDVGYVSLHKWVKRQYWEAKECVYCGARDRRIEWASISHKAKRDLDDYIPLCVPCHRRYDDIGNKVWASRRAKYA